MNKLTTKAYSEHKNKLYTLVTFKDGNRTLTYGNLNIAKLAEEIAKATQKGLVSLAYEGVAPHLKDNITDYLTK